MMLLSPNHKSPPPPQQSQQQSSQQSQQKQLQLLRRFLKRFVLFLLICFFVIRNVDQGITVVVPESVISSVSISSLSPIIQSSNDYDYKQKIDNTTRQQPSGDLPNTTNNTTTTNNNNSSSSSFNSNTMTKSSSRKHKNKKIVTIAYAITVTDCQPKSVLIDSAAILKHSIHLVTRQAQQQAKQQAQQQQQSSNSSSSSSSFYYIYDYQMIAFVYHDNDPNNNNNSTNSNNNSNCIKELQQLGYNIQFKSIPITSIQDIQNKQLQLAINEHGCCGSKELLKLYGYTLLNYKLVVLLDVDCIVMKSLDNIFHYMLYHEQQQEEYEYEQQEQRELYEYEQQQQRDEQLLEIITKARMWPSSDSSASTSTASTDLSLLSSPIPDAMFTRDYNLVDPPKKQPHQIGVQGGFLIIRPNMTDFHEYQEILYQRGKHTNTFQRMKGWGGGGTGTNTNTSSTKEKEHGHGHDGGGDEYYGGYWGYSTIQGLVSYYYGAIQPKTRSMELNRCYYNSMVDDPLSTNRQNRNIPIQCRTLEKPITSCQDCRLTPVDEVYTAHFTLCGKPYWCPTPHHWPVPNLSPTAHKLCMEFHRIWHQVRWDLEQMWVELCNNNNNINNTITIVNNSDNENTTTTTSTTSSSFYYPNLANFSDQKAKFPDNVMYYLKNYALGHCRKPNSKGYKKLRYPGSFYSPTQDVPLLWK